MHLRRGTRNWMALAIVSFPIAGLRGQGFGLNELSTCGIGRAYSAVATGCHDPSAIYWNPAAITDAPVRDPEPIARVGDRGGRKVRAGHDLSDVQG